MALRAELVILITCTRLNSRQAVNLVRIDMLRAVFPFLLIALIAACDQPTRAVPAQHLEVAVRGAINEDLTGLPRFHAYPYIIDAYSFEIRSGLDGGGRNQYLIFSGETGRPRVGVYALTPLWSGTKGQRVHAQYGRDIPGGGEQYHAVSGHLTITFSSPEAVVGEFAFEGVRGVGLPDRVELHPDSPRVTLSGRFSARCSFEGTCR